jgi:uncharacterized protein (TIGR00251 family)
MGELRITVRVTPRAVRDEITGSESGELLVRVTSPPDEGRANAAVCALVGAALCVPKTAVRLVRGHRSRCKVLEVSGPVDADRLERLRTTPPPRR